MADKFHAQARALLPAQPGPEWAFYGHQKHRVFGHMQDNASKQAILRIA